MDGSDDLSDCSSMSISSSDEWESDSDEGDELTDSHNGNSDATASETDESLSDDDNEDDGVSSSPGSPPWNAWPSSDDDSDSFSAGLSTDNKEEIVVQPVLYKAPEGTAIHESYALRVSNARTGVRHHVHLSEEDLHPTEAPKAVSFLRDHSYTRKSLVLPMHFPTTEGMLSRREKADQANGDSFCRRISAVLSGTPHRRAYERELKFHRGHRLLFISC